jgi:hypothetical protein
VASIKGNNLLETQSIKEKEEKEKEKKKGFSKT